MEHRKQSLSQRFDEYQPSKKGLVWACAGSVVLALVAGFSWGGWVTGSTAREMAENSAGKARQELIAVVCVDRFMTAPDAGNQLTALQEITSSYSRGKFIEAGGWASLGSLDSEFGTTLQLSVSDQRKAVGLCAAELAKREMPAAGNATIAQ
jgi:hypothetical protein